MVHHIDMLLVSIAVLLLAVLVLVRRSQKPAASSDVTRLVGATLHELQDAHATLQRIADYLKPEIRVVKQEVSPRDLLAPAKPERRRDGGKQTRKVRAGTGRG